MSQDKKCFACGKKLGKAPARVDTRDGQTVFVGSDCFRKVQSAGEAGYLPKLGLRLWAMKAE